MEIQQQRHGAVTVLRPQGPLAQLDAKEFEDRLKEALSQSLGRVVVDASAMPFVDSAGLESLLNVTEQLNKGGQALKLCGVNETVREILELTELASSFEHFEEILDAVRSYL